MVSTPDFLVQLGWIEFHNCDQLIALKDEVVLSCERTGSGIVRVSGKFQDPDGNLVAVLEDNEWRVLIEQVWDVEHIAARRLIVRTGPGTIVLRMDITDTGLAIQQCFFRRDNVKLTLKGDDEHTDK